MGPPTILEISAQIRFLKARQDQLEKDELTLGNRVGESFLHHEALKDHLNLLRLGLTNRMENIEARVGRFFKGNL